MNAYVQILEGKKGKTWYWAAYLPDGSPLASGVERDSAHEAAADAKLLLDHGIEIRLDENEVIST